MQGFSIVFFAAMAMTRDVGATVRLTMLPWAVGLAVVFCMLHFMAGVGLSGLAPHGVTPTALAPGYFPAVFLSFFVFGAIACWTGISWHRHILLKETALSVLPRRNTDNFAPYLRAAAKLGLLAAAILLMIDALMVPLIPALGLVGPGAKLVSIAVNALLVSLVLRFGLVLPAAALGRPISMEDSWAATRGYSGPVFALALCAVLTVELTALIPGGGIAAHLLGLAGGWSVVVLTLGMLTVLYGVRIQGRRLII